MDALCALGPRVCACGTACACLTPSWVVPGRLALALVQLVTVGDASGCPPGVATPGPRGPDAQPEEALPDSLLARVGFRAVCFAPRSESVFTALYKVFSDHLRRKLKRRRAASGLPPLPSGLCCPVQSSRRLRACSQPASPPECRHLRESGHGSLTGTAVKPLGTDAGIEKSASGAGGVSFPG